MSRADVLFTDKVWNFCQQFLFTRVKFLPRGWKVYDPNSTTNFAALVKRHVLVGEDMTFGTPGLTGFSYESFEFFVFDSLVLTPSLRRQKALSKGCACGVSLIFFGGSDFPMMTT